MTKLAYTLHRIFAGVLLLLILFSMAGSYFDLGFISERDAKGLLIFAILAVVIYGAFFAPTRQDMREQRGAKKARKSR